MKKQINLRFLFILFGIISSINGFAQIAVSGTVTDSHGEVLPGVEIIVVGTQNGTVTDFDGHYTIKANKGDKIKASYIGMTSQTKTVTGPRLDFVLKDDALGLDEVVVTAQSGIVTKKQLGSVIHSVKMSEVGNRPVTNAAEALQGIIPGAQIMRNNGAAAPSISIRLRGPSTILGSSEPLIMIDGVIINNQERAGVGTGGSSDPLSDIDMSDIDHIEILKGPAASAMYGSLASNGIIQIFTKKPKNGQPKITVTSGFNINKIRKYKPYNKVLLKWQNNGGVLEPVPIDKRYDYQSYIFRTGFGASTNVNVSGGTDYTTYSIGGSYLSNEGIVRNSNYERKNLNLKLDQKINDKLRFNVSVLFSNNDTKEIPYGLGYHNPLSSILFLDNSKELVNGDAYNPVGWMGNPYESIDIIDAKLKVNRIIPSFNIHYNPFENLNIDYVFGYDHASENSKYFIPQGSVNEPHGILQFTENAYENYNSHIRANYNYNITDGIKASTGAGYQYMYDKKKYNIQSKKNLSVFPNLQNMDGSNDIKATSALYEYAIWGTWVQQHFNFYDKFHLTLGGRWDQASTFGNDVQKFYPKVSGALILSDFDFWKNNLGKIFNSFKLRGAWGEAGNMSVLTSSSYINVKEGSLLSPSSYLGQTAYILSSIDGNKKIRPEVTKELEFGFDASLLDGRLGIEFTKYHQNVYDLVLAKAMALSSGYVKKVENVGTLTNDGIEVTLSGVPVKTKTFTWNSSINFSTNKNVVSDIEGGYISLNVFGNDNAILANGYPMTTFYGTFYATDENGNWVLDANGNPQRAKGIMIDEDGDGFPESYEQQFDSNGQPTGNILKKVLGKTSPDYIVSFNNTFKYKNFDLNVNVEAVQGYNVLDWDKRMAYSLSLSSLSLFTGWEFAGEELEYNKRGYYGNRFRIYESFVEDGSFVKLRNVSLSYNWKKPVKGIDNMRFTVSGSNLISWDSYWGYDPEVNAWGKSNVVRAEDFANIPIPRVYSFGFQLKF